MSDTTIASLMEALRSRDEQLAAGGGGGGRGGGRGRGGGGGVVEQVAIHAERRDAAIALLREQGLQLERKAPSSRDG